MHRCSNLMIGRASRVQSSWKYHVHDQLTGYDAQSLQCNQPKVP